MSALVHFSPLFTGAFVAGLWQGLVIALMAAALCRLLPHASPSLRHGMLLALFASALILPWIALTGAPGGEAAEGLQITPWISDFVALLWLSFAAIRAIQLYLAWRHLCGVRRRSTPIEVQGLAELQGGRRSVVLCSSVEVDSPSILGFGTPRLLLPDWMVPQLSEMDMQQIALHECEHLRRGDDWTNFLLQVGIMLAPLNPALLWINSRIRLQRELAVDAAVVAQTSQPISYANCLTRFAEQRRQRGRVRLALAALGRRSELIERVQILLSRPSFWTGPQSAWAAGTASVALLTLGIAMARAPHFVHVGRLDREIQTSQLPATDVPPAAVVPVGASGAPFVTSAARMVPTAFHVESRQSRGFPATRLDLTEQKAHSSAYRRAALKHPRSGAPDRARAPNPTQRRGVTSLRKANQNDVANVRLMTVKFYAPYVALPTSNGWIFIEL